MNTRVLSQNFCVHLSASNGIVGIPRGDIGHLLWEWGLWGWGGTITKCKKSSYWSYFGRNLIIFGVPSSSVFGVIGSHCSVIGGFGGFAEIRGRFRGFCLCPFPALFGPLEILFGLFFIITIPYVCVCPPWSSQHEVFFCPSRGPRSLFRRVDAHQLITTGRTIIRLSHG